MTARHHITTPPPPPPGNGSTRRFQASRRLFILSILGIAAIAGGGIIFAMHNAGIEHATAFPTTVRGDWIVLDTDTLALDLPEHASLGAFQEDNSLNPYMAPPPPPIDTDIGEDDYPDVPDELLLGLTTTSTDDIASSTSSDLDGSVAGTSTILLPNESTDLVSATSTNDGDGSGDVPEISQSASTTPATESTTITTTSTEAVDIPASTTTGHTSSSEPVVPHEPEEKNSTSTSETPEAQSRIKNFFEHLLAFVSFSAHAEETPDGEPTSTTPTVEPPPTPPPPTPSSTTESEVADELLESTPEQSPTSTVSIFSSSTASGTPVTEGDPATSSITATSSTSQYPSPAATSTPEQELLPSASSTATTTVPVAMVPDARFPIQRTLILSRFDTDSGLATAPSNINAGARIRRMTLNLSIATDGREGSQDELAITYTTAPAHDLSSTSTPWFDLVTFVQNNASANGSRGGYLSYDIPIAYENLSNLAVRIQARSTGEEVPLPAFLDAVWVGIEYQNGPEPEPDKNLLRTIERGDFIEIEDDMNEFTVHEPLHIRFRYTRNDNVVLAAIRNAFGTSANDYHLMHIAFVDEKGREVHLPYTLIRASDRTWDLIVPTLPDGFRPGTYRLRVGVVENGTLYESAPAFSYGVLAVNFDQSVYRIEHASDTTATPPVVAHIQMGALDDAGNTICNASLELTVTDPHGVEHELPIVPSDTCGPETVTDVPDYAAHYRIQEVGEHAVRLIRFDNAGSVLHEITDSFAAHSDVPFTLKRIGATRIYPRAPYRMTLTGIAHADFAGTFTEVLPEGFRLLDVTASSSRSGNAVLPIYAEPDNLVWSMSVRTGDTFTLSYTYDAPDRSPALYLLGPGSFTDTTGNIAFTEARSWQLASDALQNQRANTVQFYAGQYSSGDGTTGQNSNQDQSLPSSTLKLVESNVVIRNAFVLLEAHTRAYADSGDVTGHQLAFDACATPCMTDPWSGSGRVLQDASNTILAEEDVTGSTYLHLIADVTSETQLAAYTGGGSSLDFQIGYRFNHPTSANSIAIAKAKLYVTYAYDATSAEITNTVVYPLESSASGDQGSRTAVQTSGCTYNSTCPLFDYTATIPELTSSSTQRVSAWFEVGGQRDSGGASDVYRNINIQGTDINTPNYIHESAQGSGQGNWSAGWWEVSGFDENTVQQLEHYFLTGNQYVVGGEIFDTYIASSSAQTSTKTISFPIGIISNGTVASTQLASTTVYLPEEGVAVQKAWVRILANMGDTNGEETITVQLKTGSNATDTAIAYSYNPPGNVTHQTPQFFHVVSSTDYAELETASATSGVPVYISVTASDTNSRSMSGELMVTYTYTSDNRSYQTSLALFGGQTTGAGTSQSQTVSTASGVFPERSGAKALRGAMLRAAYNLSDSDSAVEANPVTADANLAISSPTCSNQSVSDADGSTAFFEFFNRLLGILTTTDGQSYQACYTNNGSADASGGAKMNGILHYTYQVDLPTLELSAYRWFANNTSSADVGAPLGAQDTAAEAPGQGTPFRLRFLTHIADGDVASGTAVFKMQYAVRSGTCDTGFAGESYVDVSPTAGTIRFFNNTSTADGAFLIPNANDPTHSTHTIVAQTYEESNPMTNATNTPIADGDDGIWDTVLVDFSAPTSTTYCFRVIQNDDELLDTYSVIPEITTSDAVVVSATSTQTASTTLPISNFHIGGAFTFIRGTSTATTTEILLTEVGTVDANADVSNLLLFYKEEATCSLTIPGDATQFNATSTTFNGSEQALATGTMPIGTNQVCLYVQINISSNPPNNSTLDIQITNPNTDVAVTPGYVLPTSTIDITGNTTLLQPGAAFFTQGGFRFYENIDAVDPTTPLAAENTSATVAQGAPTRLRMNIGITDSALATTSNAFDLQYSPLAAATSCANIADEDFGDVGTTASSTPWRFFNNTSTADGATIGSLLLTSSTAVESYGEGNPTPSNPTAIANGGYGEWDWVLENNNATSSATYCFRMVKSNGTPLDAYNRYPEVVVSDPTVQTHYRWRNDDGGE